MERSIYKKLLEWKNSSMRKPLILEGARQVGKTWILKKFGENEYKKFVYINCDNNPQLAGLFSDYDIPRIIRFLSALTDTTITEDDTLIFFDEIQELDRGLAALKYFCENASGYHVVVAGSLLGMEIHHGTGFPVGKVDQLHLSPLSFKEFLLASGKKELVLYMETHKWNELSKMRELLIDFLRQYYYVGGMPEVVQQYIDTQDLKKVRKLQKNILSDYRRDFSKHAPKEEITRINMVWDSIPRHLAKENKKFVYGALKHGGRAKEFEKAIMWLKDAGLVHKINRIDKICKPLKFYEDEGAFKLFISDVGLLGAMVDASAKDMLINNSVFEEYKGAFTEQYVAQQYFSIKTDGLYYYTNENSTSEIDFVMQGEAVYPIEVKAEENLRAKSLSTVLKKNEQLVGWRMSMSDYREQERLVNVPLYLCEEWLIAHNS